MGWLEPARRRCCCRSAGWRSAAALAGCGRRRGAASRIRAAGRSSARAAAESLAAPRRTPSRTAATDRRGGGRRRRRSRALRAGIMGMPPPGDLHLSVAAAVDDAAGRPCRFPLRGAGLGNAEIPSTPCARAARVSRVRGRARLVVVPRAGRRPGARSRLPANARRVWPAPEAACLGDAPPAGADLSCSAQRRL